MTSGVNPNMRRSSLAAMPLLNAVCKWAFAGSSFLGQDGWVQHHHKFVQQSWFKHKEGSHEH